MNKTSAMRVGIVLWTLGIMTMAQNSGAREVVTPSRIQPSALLSIDQNRSTVVDRIVGEWGDRLAASSAVQLQVFGIPINGGSNGDVEILPQGSTFGSTATLVYLGNVLLTSASTTARINLANNQIGVQVRGGGADLAIDVVGYFKPPAGTVQPGAILWVAKSGGNY